MFHLQGKIKLTSAGIKKDIPVDMGMKRALRADARRNVDLVLTAAKDVFQASGVDAPVRDIASKAGVGMGTLYRHFPQRADLIAAVFRKEVDACADAAGELCEGHTPSECLTLWLQRYAALIGTKRGLSAALHSGDPAYSSLPDYFESRLLPALDTLSNAAIDAGEVRSDIDPRDLLGAVGCLGMRSGAGSAEQTERMVGLLVDGLRYRAE